MMRFLQLILIAINCTVILSAFNHHHHPSSLFKSFQCSSIINQGIMTSLSQKVVMATAIAFLTTTTVQLPFIEPVYAVSGGGKDFATKDIRGQSFEKQSLSRKDFTQCNAVGTIFKSADLKGARFYRANLNEADFTYADLSTASLEDTSLVDADFSNAILNGAYLSGSIQDAKSINGADFTDALMPDFATNALCKRMDIGGKNPVTGVVTADSLMCP